MVECSKCSYCDKPAIGYEAGGDRGMMYCEDHASKELLAMKPGEEYDEKNGRLSWEFLAETGKLVPDYRCKFLTPGKQNAKIEEIPYVEGYWTIEDCADVLMVHRPDIYTLARKGYFEMRKICGNDYVKYKSIHRYINMVRRWGILLPIVWKLGLCKEEKS